MDEQIERPVPQAWLDALARSDADIAAGRTVPGQEVMRRLHQTIADMEATSVIPP